MFSVCSTVLYFQRVLFLMYAMFSVVWLPDNNRYAFYYGPVHLRLVRVAALEPNMMWRRLVAGGRRSSWMQALGNQFTPIVHQCMGYANPKDYCIAS